MVLQVLFGEKMCHAQSHNTAGVDIKSKPLAPESEALPQGQRAHLTEKCIDVDRIGRTNTHVMINACQMFELGRTLQSIQGELRSLNCNYTDMNTKVDTLFDKLNTNYEQLRTDHDELKAEFPTLQKCCEYLESQSRRNNLVFHGFAESEDETLGRL